MARVTTKELQEQIQQLAEQLATLTDALIESQVPEKPWEPTEAEDTGTTGFDEHAVLNPQWKDAKIAKANNWARAKGLPKGSVIVWHVRSKLGKDSVIFRQIKSGRPANAVGGELARV
jgi:hypothetical protein